MLFKKTFWMLFALIFATGLSWAKGPVTVGSKIDTEGALLGQVIVHVLEHNGFEVVDKTELGVTSIVRKAITSGQIDIYPEYTGNGAFFFNQTDSTVWKNPQKGYETVKKLDYDANKIVWLKPAPANNTWAIAMRKDVAQKHNLKTLSDMAAYINKGGDYKLAGSEEFANRPDALPAFQEAYGFKLNQDQLITLSGGNTSQTEKAAAQGINGVNAAMAYGTDGALAALGLVVLTDDKGIQPVYEPAPIIREDTHKKYPEIETLLAPVFKGLNLETLQQLNARIAIEGLEASKVAEEYLKQHQFIK